MVAVVSYSGGGAIAVSRALIGKAVQLSMLAERDLAVRKRGLHTDAQTNCRRLCRLLEKRIALRY